MEGLSCKCCSAIFLGSRSSCASCGSRDGFEPKKLANTGTLHVYSIAHRSLPGVEVPYVSAIVDLEGGGTLKGNPMQAAAMVGQRIRQKIGQTGIPVTNSANACATGVANSYEVSTHLRGEAGDRQVEGARLGLTHVIGLGSACGIHILEKVS